MSPVGGLSGLGATVLFLDAATLESGVDRPSTVTIDLWLAPELEYAPTAPTNDEFGPAAMIRLARSRLQGRLDKKARNRQRYLRRMRA